MTAILKIKAINYFPIVGLMTFALCAFFGRVAAEAPMSRPSTDPTTRVVVFGILTLSDGVTPLPGMMVGVTSSDVPPASMIAQMDADITNKLGAFLLDETVSPGTYSIISVHNGNYIIAKERLVVAKTAGSDVVLHVKAAAGSLAGSVINAAGNPADNARVSILNRPDHLVYSANTDKDGHYIIRPSKRTC